MKGNRNIVLVLAAAGLAAFVSKGLILIVVSAKVASNHSKILRKDFRAVAQAVRDTPAPDDTGGPTSEAGLRSMTSSPTRSKALSPAARAEAARCRRAGRLVLDDHAQLRQRRL